MKQVKMLARIIAVATLIASLAGCSTSSGQQTISTQPAHPYTRQQADALIQKVQQDATLSAAQKQQKIKAINDIVIPVSGSPR